MKKLFSEAEILSQVEWLAGQIREKMDGAVVIGVLKGSFIFLADLLRDLHYAGFVVEDVGFIEAERYRGVDGGRLWIGGVSADVHDKTVLVIEDIVDQGETIKGVKEQLRVLGAAEVWTCALFVREGVWDDGFVDFKGFRLEGDKFVVGYGLDHNGKHRELPFIATLEREDLEEMSRPIVTLHAIERFQQRVEDVPYEQVVDRILCALNRSRNFDTDYGAERRYDEVERIILVCRRDQGIEKVLTIETAFWEEI